jgi:TetR/AcrR family transcriptional repressor of nem operon
MARPRSYERQEVVEAAKQVFWDQGYVGTALGDIEGATGLSRSSLYLAFGTKKGLFDAALAEYLGSFIEPRFSPVEAPGASLGEAAGFFSGLATLVEDRESQRGCLYINSIAELSSADPAWEARGAAFADRLRNAFLNALQHAERQGAMSRGQATTRANLLAASALGVWVTVRGDHAAAAATCRAIAAEITSWDRSRSRSRATKRARMDSRSR